MAVVTRAVADTDPKWSGETSKLEHSRLITFMGKGAAQFICDITVTWQVPGSTAFTDTIEGCFIGDEGQTSKAGDAAMAKLGSGCNRVLYNGIDILESPIT